MIFQKHGLIKNSFASTYAAMRAQNHIKPNLKPFTNLHQQSQATSLFQMPYRSFFFGTRLLNKQLKKQSHFHHGYDTAQYLIAMKDF